MTEQDVAAFVDHWCAAWNAHDLDAITGHFSEDATFTSPKATQMAGHHTLSGRSALRAYWGVAIERATTRVFTPERYIWDDKRQELALIYISEVDGYRRRAVEFFRFNEAGDVFSGEAMYGAEF